MKIIANCLRVALAIATLIAIFPGCKKDPHHPDPAKGSLFNEYGQCMPGTVHGIFYNGFTANTDTNYVDINVHVTSPGYYHIVTEKLNGVSFSAAGIFTDTGFNGVRLKGTGSFINPVTTVYPITFDSSECRLYVYVQDSAGLSIADNTWQFTASGRTFRGTCVAALYQIPQVFGSAFQFEGHMASGSPDTSLYMNFYTNENYNLDTISYPTSTTGYYFSFYEYKNNTTRYFYTADNTTLPAVIDIHPTSVGIRLTPSYGNVVIATFNGTARDSANNIVPITNARFKVVY